MDFVAHPKATYLSRNGLLSPFATWLRGWDSAGRCWDALVAQLPSPYPHCQLSHSPSKTNGMKKYVNIFLQHRKFKGSASLFRETRGIRPFFHPSSEHQRLAFPSAETNPPQEGGRRKRRDTGLSVWRYQCPSGRGDEQSCALCLPGSTLGWVVSADLNVHALTISPNLF